MEIFEMVQSTRVKAVYFLCACYIVTSISLSQLRCKFRKTSNRLLGSYFDEHVVDSSISCCLLCAQNVTCNNVNYESSTGKCQLTRYHELAVNCYSAPSSTWAVYSKNNEWYTVFRGFTDIGLDPYKAWVSGTSVTTDTACLSAACTHHYRDDLVKDWNCLSISQVKFAFYVGATEVAYITFNGTGSNILSWFSTNRTLNSTWDGVHNVAITVFSIEGFVLFGRRFHIASYGSCKGDRIAMGVITSSAGPCTFDKHDKYPKFLYSTTNEWSKPGDGTGISFGYADSIQILLKMD